MLPVMGANCYVCEDEIAPIPTFSASNSPQGTCWRCHVLACRGHAQRDPNRLRFVCVLCDPQLLTASAAINQGASRPLAQRFAADWGHGDLDMLVNTFQEFLERRPKYQGWLDEAVDAKLHDAGHQMKASSTGPLWIGSNPEAERLFLAAIAIVTGLAIPNHSLSVAMRLLVSSWR
jgi:hypothetical protein